MTASEWSKMTAEEREAYEEKIRQEELQREIEEARKEREEAIKMRFQEFKAQSKEWTYKWDAGPSCEWSKPDYKEVLAPGQVPQVPVLQFGRPCDEKAWNKMSKQCGVHGWMSPIATSLSSAPQHPTAQPTDLILGKGDVLAKPQFGGPPPPPCSQGIFITSRHTLEVRLLGGKKMPRDSIWGAEDEIISCKQALKKASKVGGNYKIPPHCLRPCTLPTAGLSRAPRDLHSPTPPQVYNRGPIPLTSGKSQGRLLYYNFHSPSEHVLDGGYYPIEMHLVHGQAIIAVFIGFESAALSARCSNINATSTIDAISQEEMTLQTECRAAFWFERLIGEFPNVQSYKDQTAKEQKNFPIKYVTMAQNRRAKIEGLNTIPPPILTGFDIKDNTLASLQRFVDWNSTLGQMSMDPYASFVIPPARFFYYYLGSYTSPPCTLGVHWIIHPKPIHIFNKDITKLRNILTINVQNSVNQGASFLRFGDAMPVWNALSAYNQTPITWDLNNGNNNRNPVDQLKGPSIPNWPYSRKFYRVGKVDWGNAVELKYLDSSPLWASGFPKSMNNSGSSSLSGESDSPLPSFNSMQSSGSMGSGSFGFYMALWKWAALVVCCCCCCCVACMSFRNTEDYKELKTFKKSRGHVDVDGDGLPDDIS